MDDASLLMVMLGNREQLEIEIKDRKTALDEINKAIAEKAAPHAEAAFNKAGKVDGTVKFAIGNRIFKAVIGKTVSYDSDALQGIAGSIPWEQSQEIFDIKFSVSERAFKAIEDEDLKKRITEARTTKYSAPKITAED